MTDVVARGLTKPFGPVTAGRDMSFTAPAGVAAARPPRPRRQVGALLEATGFHPGRRARDHLRVLAAAERIPGGRVDEVLGQVDLAEVAGRPGRGFSPGL